MVNIFVQVENPTEDAASETHGNAEDAVVSHVRNGRASNTRMAFRGGDAGIFYFKQKNLFLKIILENKFFLCAPSPPAVTIPLPVSTPRYAHARRAFRNDPTERSVLCGLGSYESAAQPGPAGARSLLTEDNKKAK